MAKTGLLDMSKTADRKKAASILAGYGRKGDKTIAHITPEEAALLKARGGSGTINPKTGLLEFMDSDGQGTSESAATGAGTDSYGSVGGGYGDSGAASYGGKDEGDRARDAAAAAAPGAGPFGEATGWTHGYTPTTVDLYANDRPVAGFFNSLGNKAIHSFADMANNPGRTIANGLISMTPLGIPNSLAGLMFGQDKTLGGALMAGARSLTDYQGLSSPTTAALSDGEADMSGSGGNPGPGDGMDARGFEGQRPAPAQVANNTSPEQVAQQALRRAIITAPGAMNQWSGNFLNIPTGPWTPQQRNTWAGNRMQIPGLLS